MFGKGMATVGAALVLASLLAMTGASAAPRGALGLRNHAANAGGQKTFASRVPANRNTNFGFSGPYVGMKFIGRQ
jgi:hypothetical protein